MKLGIAVMELDATDQAILNLLQENCKQPLAAIGEKVSLSAPAVMERINKLEDAGVILGYAAQLDARRAGRDVTAFIGVSTDRPAAVRSVERELAGMDDILECHHVTGAHTLVIKIKTRSTATLEQSIDRIRALDGVTRTETMVVLSSLMERTRIVFEEVPASPRRNARGGSAKKSPRRKK